nr:hypothetical protein BaRGS_022489 [Batillaria attramentaria]
MLADNDTWQKEFLLNFYPMQVGRSHVQASQRSDPVYELRVYYIKPDKFHDYMALMADNFDIRLQASQPLGFWTTEFGGLFEVVHIWPYDSVDHRAEVRQALAKNPEWNSKFLSKFLQYANSLQNSLSHPLPWVVVVVGRGGDDHLPATDRSKMEDSLQSADTSMDTADDPLADLSDEQLYQLVEETIRANQVLEAETRMFEKFLRRVEPKDASTSGGHTSFTSSMGHSLRDDTGRMGNRKRSKSRSSNMDRSLKLSAEQKCDIAQREIEELREEIEKLKEESEKVLDTYKAIMEEADMRLAETKKESYEFERDIVKGSVNNRTARVIAEKVMRYFDDRLRARKEEMGEVLHEVDFNQLKIENQQYLERIDERNQDLLRLKLMAGNTLQVLNTYKKKLNTLTMESERLGSEILSRNDLLTKIDAETSFVEVPFDITIGRKWRRSLLDVRAKRGADAASDHHLVIAAIKIKLKAYRDQADRPSHKYNVHSLKESVKTNAFRCELRNRFSALDTLPEETIEEHWHDLRETWTATCREVLGKKTRQHKEWLTSDTWDLITERKRLKDLINHTDDQDHKRDLQAQYWDVNRQVKRSARNDKRNFINDLTEEAETAAGQRNMKRLYEITRTLSGKNNNPTRPVKDKNGQIITKEEDQRTRWAEHFKETLNRPPPPVPPDIPPAAQLLDISTNPPTKTEIIKAIKSLKSGKAAGPDGIPPEALKADIQTSTDMLHPLLRKIWESESVPQDWKKGHLVKLPKKGDLSSCSNWRGIMLLSIPGKVLTRIILERLKTALDKTLREEQAGFRNDRSCTDHIATMRIIIEQSLEWQTPLYSIFVDFQKAFDSVDREVIWKLMSHYGFPPKFVNIIRQLYEDATCQVIHDGKLTEPFTVRTGVRQGCILSPTIFLMVVDWVMRQATDGKWTGIQWTFSKQLEDLDFADDIALLSHKQQDAQEKLNRVAEEAKKTGLKINISKTEVMRVNHKQHDPIQLHQEDIKEVDKFIYLGSVVSKDGGTDEDIKSRTNKARHAFRTLRPIWRSTALSLRNKIRIFNSNVKSVLLYGSETWRTTKTGSHRLQTFINRCLRNILNIRYPLVITNQDLWERTRQVPIEQEIKKRKWGWIGHTLRKPTSNVTRQSLDWNPQGKRKERAKAEKINRKLRQQLADYRVPDVMHYVQEKADLYELQKKVKSWERKVEIADMALKTHRKTWRQMQYGSQVQPQWQLMQAA